MSGPTSRLIRQMDADAPSPVIRRTLAGVRRATRGERVPAMSKRRRLDRLALARALGVPAWALEAGRENELLRLLMHDHADAIRGLAYAMLHDSRDTDEVVCDTFRKAVREVLYFRGDCSARTWLWRIDHSLCIDKLRCGKRHISVPFDDAVPPETQQQSPRHPSSLQEAIEKLSPYHRAVVRLHLAGYTIVKLAELMDVRRSTLSDHYNDALRQLRTLLARDSGEEDDHDGMMR